MKTNQSKDIPGASPSTTGLEIAVLGMAGRLPGADSIDEFWDNLKKGVESIGFFSSEELEEAGVENQVLVDLNYIKAGIRLADPWGFDASFFGYTPREAEKMDPQVRIFFECIWAALEDAGYAPGDYDGRIGLYAGASANIRWEIFTILSGSGNLSERFSEGLLRDKDFLSTLISYKLNLKGPSLVVSSACSTSLASIHLACRALLYGECKMALAGGVTQYSGGGKGYFFQEDMITSRDGHCRAFDARAAGTIFGDGAGVVVLKRLKNALADGDHVYAVIKGSSINNDGSRKMGYTAPSIEGQMEVIRGAMRMAQVEPESITVVECHGTATPLGDPIEIEGLKMAFNTEKRQYCAVGSVKTNVGHLDHAAGVVGFIKTVLALRYRLIPPSLHFETCNPKIDFENSPFYVNTTLQSWPENGYPLRAGVSSFGIGGTNAHVILEEAPVTGHSSSPAGIGREYQLIVLSAKTADALENVTRNLVRHLRQNPGIPVADAAYTLQVGRKALTHRRMLVCPASAAAEAVNLLLSPGHGKVKTGCCQEGKRFVVFMFPGLGSQYVNMGRELYLAEPVFRQEMDRCFTILNELLDFEIKEILYPGMGEAAVSAVELTGTGNRSLPLDIDQTDIAQLTVFILEYALARLLLSWGIKPQAMIGYSFGEYTAACVSGVFSLEAALKLVVIRGQLLQQLPAGAMLSIPLPRHQVELLLNPGNKLSLAIDNGSSCVVSGPVSAIEEFEIQMKEKRLFCMRVRACRALHSRMMEPILSRFVATLDGFSGSKPEIPYISNVTGTWQTVEEAANPRYWAFHLRRPVRFATGIEELLKTPNVILIEVGPGRDLTSLVNRYKDQNPGLQVVDLVRVETREISDSYYLLHKIGQLWLYGTGIDWTGLHGGEKRQRIPLPKYPFEHQHYTIGDPGALLKKGAEFLAGATGETLEKKKDIADWFYVPSWKRSLLQEPGDHEPGSTEERGLFLVFLDEQGIGEQLTERLRQSGASIVYVRAGTSYSNDQKKLMYTIRPGQEEDYQRLFADMAARGGIPGKILHLWNITGKKRDKDAREDGIEYQQDIGFYSLLFIARTITGIGAAGFNGNVILTVVGNHICKVTGEEELLPGKSTLLGPLNVISQEYPGLECRYVDIVLPASSGLGHQLFKEVICKTARKDKVVALRREFRWVQVFDSISLKKPGNSGNKIKDRGVYIITGGTGKIGLELAVFLAGQYRARLVLTGSTTLPERDKWDELLSHETNEENNQVGRKIRKIRELEQLGSEVLVLRADTANFREMQEVVFRARQCFGEINGVIHAAGLVSPCLIKQMTRDEARKQFQTKVYGLLTLKEVLTGLDQSQPVDFCFLLSTSASVLGGLGYAAYAGANIFMDTFVQEYSGNGSTAWKSYNLDVWDYPGTGSKNRGGTGGAEHGLSRLAMTREEGFEAFVRVLNCEEAPQVIQSTGNLQTRLDQWVNIAVEEEEEAAKKPSVRFYPRPALLTPYVPPGNQLQEELADIWQRVLGIRQPGIQDDFFELGGDSLKAISVVDKVHKELEAEVSITDFFKLRTLEKLAEQLTNKVRENTMGIIEPVEKREYYLLSSAQKRLFILQQMDLETLGYNLGQTFSLQGQVERQQLETSFRQLIKRHESLRTSFHMIKDKPVQRIHPEVEFEMEYVDLVLEGEDKLQSAEGVIKTFIRPFNLSQVPLLRSALLKLEENRYVLVVDMHHIIHDGVSQVLFFHELMVLCSGTVLPAVKNQYKEYSAWQNRYLERGIIKKQEKYWLEEFRGEIPLLNLPLDFQRPVIQGQEGAVISFRIEKAETQALRELALKEGVTLFMVIFSIYSILLAKLSGQEDIVIGTPVAGRRHPDVQSIMGLFLNTLALRSFPAADKSVQTFLAEVKARTLSAFDNQDYPFEDLVERVEVKRDLSRNPIFDVMLILHTHFRSLPGDVVTPVYNHLPFTLTPYRYEKKTSEFDITFVGYEVGEILSFNVEYSITLFKASSIERLIRYFSTLVKSVIDNSQQPISCLEFMSQVEKQQLLVDFNDTAVDYAADKTLPQLFSEQVKHTPDQTALVGRCGNWGTDFEGISGSITLSYRELDERAGRLARRLIERGVRSGVVVGILVERTEQMVVGLLGILKAGGIYLPLDPEYPEARIKYILEKSSTRMLLTQGKLINQSREIVFPGEIIDIQGEGINKGVQGKMKCEESIRARGGSAEPAYVIYTSGSTGNPKGVMVSHRQAINFIKGMTSVIDFSSGKVILAITTISFDIFFLETILPLICGMRVVIAGEGEQKDPGRSGALIVRNCVTMVQLTPSRLQLLLDLTESQPALTGVQELMVGGEAFPVQLLKRVQESFLGRIYNMYGPTETTIWSGVKELTGIEPDQITVGNPIANTQFYILDRNMGLVPIGIAGELLIGGAGVAIGYLNNIGLTTERFVASPPQLEQPGNKKFLPGGPGGAVFLKRVPPGRRRQKIYKTGDLARWLSSREVEFLGRSDHQVKIRGFRVEPEEIEEQILAYEGVKEAIVSVKANAMGEKYLCAYVVSNSSNPGNGINVQGMRETLSSRLPYYMVPSYIVVLESLPLTPNGKIDKKSLPEPNPSRSHLETTYVAPATGMEKEIVGIWKEILQLEEVGIHDNFFDLGGNSLKVIQLNRMIKENFGIDIPVAKMFRNLTIRYLGQCLSPDIHKRDNQRKQQIKRADALNKSRSRYRDTIKKFAR